MKTLRGTLNRSPGSHHDYVGTLGTYPVAAHALTATLTTVCRSERPSEFLRRDRLEELELCTLCHPTRPTVPSPPPTPTPTRAVRTSRRGGGLGLRWLRGLA